MRASLRKKLFGVAGGGGFGSAEHSREFGNPAPSLEAMDIDNRPVTGDLLAHVEVSGSHASDLGQVSDAEHLVLPGEKGQLLP